ncbi:FtsX-like permease family protein [Cellulomonas sp. P22]|uniref:FtsX-like permease family protein n=1 Tax=Cellulomonas sp. P22 TaxID=3373189 RepID=UPI0037BDB0FC
MTAPATTTGTAPSTALRRRRGLSQWATDLALGIRLSVGGGSSGWVRLALVAVGVGIGVTMLLVATTIPSVIGARDGRVADRQVSGERLSDGTQAVPQADDTVLTTSVRSDFHGRAIEGMLLQPEGGDPVLPPGVTRQLAPGELLVSPALARVLGSEDGEALRGRWSDRVVGEIGPSGLAGPEELTFYLGTDELTADTATRTASFGGVEAGPDSAAPLVLLLGIVALGVLLLPVAIFLTTAVRFGGEARDRRLAALRLVGADTAMTRRIAAGETLAGAVLGLVVGGVLFLAATQFVHRVVPADLSFYPADFRPAPALAALVVILVPIAAVLVTISAMQRVVVEPLGVVRRGTTVRRRVWWRLVLPVVGLALLAPLRSGMDTTTGNEAMVLAGLVFLLVGIAVLLPWFVEATVRRMGAGGVAWQLAVRRLQLDSGTAVRAVSGIAVSVAGLIALHGLFGAVESVLESAEAEGSGSSVVTVYGASTDERWVTDLESAPGVREVGALANLWGTSADGARTWMKMGECAALAQQAQIDTCEDGDVFVVAEQGVSLPEAGSTYTFEDDDSASGPRWTLPATARTVLPPASSDSYGGQILVTPAAVAGLGLDLTDVDLSVTLDPADPDAIEHLRTAASRVDPRAHVESGSERFTAALLTMRQALFVVTIALLLMIGASMLVNVVEQLRERRQLLAVLLAFGTRRSTLSGSVLYQVAIPVTLGLLLAVATGTGLATVLQTVAGAPVQLDWVGIGTTTGVAAGVVLLTTAGSLPLLWRLTKPGGLRSE